MREKIVAAIVICMLALTACAQQESEDRGVIQQYSTEVAQTSQESIHMQQKLAQWYNLNLRSTHPDVGFERSYESILFFSDGMLGYVEIPSEKMFIPIYHDLRQDGFFLNPYSAFPIGGEGNCTKLHTDIPLELVEGDIFYVHTLDDVLAYQIGGEGNDRCMLICNDICYEGTHMVEN